jgi:hypothetical protein
MTKKTIEFYRKNAKRIEIPKGGLESVEGATISYTPEAMIEIAEHGLGVLKSPHRPQHEDDAKSKKE